ncbi:type II toxin-antitoxin system RelE/ParE family toxin [Bacteroides thetaiotaomicron]|uniref:type II toxin-antitoxin system RelE/ParE family toxin n=1 Tax=Bacteroides thetaiotaomicron TaxID=818 RepID=UPI001C8C3722|nr:type II toxin-antitoxin system RelE/ParE family toxin [Bacteroides thetaiotaomicron]MBX9049615.1 type II toxin-antitoxin system RelE/ParE family toxin [Bacteroides thetaiotaomicron]MBX9072959.1 type II toxin-antitoxin system RelE/ParE family toxin [Bacteroides thetaiotaomicron]
MAKIQFSNKAVDDLSDIWNYTLEEWSEQQADQYYQMLIASCNKIAENPALFGREYDEIADGLLGFKANKHIIFYKITGNGDIFIVRILHERMDLKIRMNE